MSLSICACFDFPWPCLWPCLRPCRNLLEGWFRDWSIKDWTKSLSTRRDTNLRSESLALSTLSPPKSKLSISWELSNKFVKIPLGDAVCRMLRITRVRRMCVLIFVCLGQKPQSECVKYYPFQANLSLNECQSQSGPDLRRGFTAAQLHDNMKIKKGSDPKSIISDAESYIIQDLLSSVLLHLNTLFGVFCNCRYLIAILA